MHVFFLVYFEIFLHLFYVHFSSSKRLVIKYLGKWILRNMACNFYDNIKIYTIKQAMKVDWLIVTENGILYRGR